MCVAEEDFDGPGCLGLLLELESGYGFVLIFEQLTILDTDLDDVSDVDKLLLRRLLILESSTFERGIQPSARRFLES